MSNVVERLIATLDFIATNLDCVFLQEKKTKHALLIKHAKLVICEILQKQRQCMGNAHHSCHLKLTIKFFHSTI